MDHHQQYEWQVEQAFARYVKDLEVLSDVYNDDPVKYKKAVKRLNWRLMDTMKGLEYEYEAICDGRSNTGSTSRPF